MAAADKGKRFLHVFLKGFSDEDDLCVSGVLNIAKCLENEYLAFEVQALEDRVDAVRKLCLKFLH